MSVIVRKIEKTDLKRAIDIWNEVVFEGVAFPQEEPLTLDGGEAFFNSQTYVAVAESAETGEVLGLYILHPNNVGRCGHIANASYCVSSAARGQGVGESLVKDCLQKAREHGFKILQFNAVVETNERARKLYEKLRFNLLGVIPGGFRLKNGKFENICLYYITL